MPARRHLRALALVALAWAVAAPAGAPTASAVGAATSGPVTAAPPRSTVGGERLALPGLQLDLPEGVPAPPRVAARAWLVADLDSGEVLAADDAHLPLAPASTLKVLTLLALVPGLDRRERHTATDADAGIDGSKVGLVPGSRYTVDDLVHGLMLGSGNDTANALADLVGGTPTAAALMTREAARLQARDTVVANTSGLDAPGQVSSVYDLALFGRAVLADPDLAEVVRTTRYRFPGEGTSLGKARERFEIQNHNRLLRNYEGATGIKNGYTVAAGGSFVGSARRGSRGYVVTVLKAKGNTWHMARDLLDWAFRHGDRASPVGRLADPLPPGAAAGGGPADDQRLRLHTGASAEMSLSPGRRVPAAVWTVAGAVALLVLTRLLLGARARRSRPRAGHSRR